jgi:hypothetical protein
MYYVEQEKLAKLLLGRSDSNYNVHHELNTHYCNSWHDPEEKFTWKKPNVSDLIMFSCFAYVHVFNEKKKKTRPKGGKMHLHWIFFVNRSI